MVLRVLVAEAVEGVLFAEVVVLGVEEWRFGVFFFSGESSDISKVPSESTISWVASLLTGEAPVCKLPSMAVDPADGSADASCGLP